jgi:hypoxanthine phosphoribosyltransferase
MKVVIDQTILLGSGGVVLPLELPVQEFLDVLGIDSDHIAIRTSSYSGIAQREKTVQVHGLSYVIKKVESENSLLIVDDVFDTGLSIHQIIKDIKRACKKNTPEIKIATPYFKPSKNKTERKPDFYIHETDSWLVFPHELHGLTVEEIQENKPELSGLIDKISGLIKSND